MSTMLQGATKTFLGICVESIRSIIHKDVSGTKIRDAFRTIRKFNTLARGVRQKQDDLNMNKNNL